MRANISRQIEIASKANANFTEKQLKERRACILPNILSAMGIIYSCPSIVIGKRAVCAKCSKKVERIPFNAVRLCMFENCLGNCRKGLSTCEEHTCQACEKNRLNIPSYTYLSRPLGDYAINENNKNFYIFVLCAKEMSIVLPKDMLKSIFKLLREPFIYWDTAHYFLRPEVEEILNREPPKRRIRLKPYEELCPASDFYECKISFPYKKSKKCLKMIKKSRSDNESLICSNCYEINTCAKSGCDRLRQETNYFCYGHKLRMFCFHNEYGLIRGESYCLSCGMAKP